MVRIPACAALRQFMMISPQVRPTLSQVIFTLSVINRVATIGNLSENLYLAQGKDGVHGVP